MTHERLPISARLRLRWLWWRHRWPFQWAHKPLCERFGREVVRIGALHVCRSCLLLYAGLISASVAVAIVRPGGDWLGPAALGAMGVTLALSIPRLYRHMPRPARDLLRLAAGGLTPVCLWALAAIGLPFAAGGAVALATLWLIYRRLRRNGAADPCAKCAHLSEGQICPGYARQAHLLRRYEAAATDLLLAAGYRPDLPGTAPKSTG